MNALTRFDTSALNRALVGFDQIFSNLEQNIRNQNNSYPPYNLLKHNDDAYEIQMAVSGFEKDEVTVEVDQNRLIIRGKRNADAASSDAEYLHRGLATRDFAHAFTLAEHLEVGEGRIKNGVLSIEIKRVIPEALKPRLIRITAD